MEGRALQQTHSSCPLGPWPWLIVELESHKPDMSRGIIAELNLPAVYMTSHGCQSLSITSNVMSRQSSCVFFTFLEMATLRRMPFLGSVTTSPLCWSSISRSRTLNPSILRKTLSSCVCLMVAVLLGHNQKWRASLFRTLWHGRHWK